MGNKLKDILNFTKHLKTQKPNDYYKLIKVNDEQRTFFLLLSTCHFKLIFNDDFKKNIFYLIFVYITFVEY